jgi:rifampicin phosphotransferase
MLSVEDNGDHAEGVRMPELYLFSEVTEPALVGGKGANLGVLTAAGFQVPPGFVVGADAYVRFLERSGLREEVEKLLGGIDYKDPEDLERRTADIRAAVLRHEMSPELADRIGHAYADLGDDPYVAVRSSATKEDSATASYAGLHDTLLDVCGTAQVVAAVQHCWASLWSARAVAYRHTQHLNHFDSPIAVVVQVMVRSEIAGVMYTGHPVTTATDEIVINTSYGLGEAVVSSAVDPDTYVVKTGTLRIKERVLGSKRIQIVRNPAGSGTITEDVPDSQRERYALTDEQVRDLAKLGRRVQEHYRGFPQDIEWAYADGRIYLLQTRPLTGVEFSWDADIDATLWDTSEDDEAYWTRDLADEAWNGAITPLMYSLRAPSWVVAHQNAAKLWGYPEIANTRFFKFYKGEAYYNCTVEKLILEKTLPPQLRALHPSGLAKLPPHWRAETLNAPFSYWGLIKQYARIEALQPQLYQGFKIFDWYMNSEESLQRARGLTGEELRDLSDVELKRYWEGQVKFEYKYTTDVWTVFYINCRDMLLLLSYLVENWYDGDTQEALGGLLTGVSRKTKTLEANHELWLMSQTIADNPALVQAFKDHPGAKFFDQVAHVEGGPELLEHYRRFIADYGHRGHSDRDVIFPRRAEDPGLDYNALKPMLSGVLDDGPRMEDPELREAATSSHRDQITEQVLQKIRSKPFGSLRAEIFKLVLDYCHRFIMVRDDERHFIDIITFSIRQAFLEMNRRLLDRGMATSDRDVFFLGHSELDDWFFGRADEELTRAKITARMRDWDRFDQKTRQLPMYLHLGHEVDLDVVEQEGNTIKGVGTSRGKVTGTARVALGLHEIGRIRHGDIMIVNSTDPGWTTVFSVISGIVLETGGMTAHGSMLAREYGLPAVQVPNATRLIPDGAKIEINGDSGLVVLVEDEGEQQTA